VAVDVSGSLMSVISVFPEANSALSAGAPLAMNRALMTINGVSRW
jgi:hypothetical protein